MITLVLGGVRSGKSEIAERIASELAQPVTCVATGTVTDPEMAARVAAHQARRDPTWATVEAGPDLADVIASISGVILLDSLGTWVAGHADLQPDVRGLLGALEGRAAPTVIVSEEVGFSVHPATQAGRRFQDSLGILNRQVADLSHRVLLVVAGRSLELPPC
jgi:adenosylcobinamide kinase/adenosylcobinamide-phosphate guanylyltransferase